MLDRGKNVLQAFNVEEAFLLPCEGRIWQVLRSGARTNRERGVRIPGKEFGVCGLDCLLQSRRQRSVHDPLSNLCAAFRERMDILCVEQREPCLDPLFEPALKQELTIGIGRCGEAIRNPDADFSQLADHFAERSILATDTFNIAHAQFVEFGDPFDACHE